MPSPSFQLWASRELPIKQAILKLSWYTSTFPKLPRPQVGGHASREWPDFESKFGLARRGEGPSAPPACLSELRKSATTLSPLSGLAPAGHYPKIAPPDSGGAAETVVLFERRHSGQKLTKSLMAASAFDGTTLRATKSSQFLNLPLTRASTMALARAGPICGSVSSSVAVAVLRLILLTTGAGVVGFAGFAGVVTAGAAGFDGCGV